jgi:hypothetical protein
MLAQIASTMVQDFTDSQTLLYSTAPLDLLARSTDQLASLGMDMLSFLKPFLTRGLIGRYYLPIATDGSIDTGRLAQPTKWMQQKQTCVPSPKYSRVR